ncbi:MAG: Calx-beta domain-containing protein, partial [Kordia sp.]|uniref:Calx-beta domain-containing protein n=1 Tax=Kordia sp. TaxID=1965332 RepID=UPI00385D3A16
MKIKLLSFLLLFAFSLSHATNKTDANRKTTTTAFMPIVTIVSVNVEESDGVAQVPIQLDVIDTVDTIISITTVDGTADSGDYTSTVVTATIPAGQLEIFLNIPITDDLDGEPSEFFTVNGTVISGNTTNTNPSGTVTIGPSNTPTATVQDVTIGEGDGILPVVISLTNPSSVDTLIDITTVDGSAVSPNDYQLTTTTATILSGDTSVTVNIPIIDDTISETSETFTVNIMVTSGNTQNATDSATMFITENDDSVVSIGDVTVSESDGVANVPVSIAGPSVVDTVIQITTVSNSATDSDDYTNTVVTATIPALQNSVNVSIPITDDTVSEFTEDFSVNGTVTSGNTINTNVSATVTITDDDDSVVSIADVTVSEADGTASVPVSIAGVSSVDTVIQITTTSGTANGLDDYVNTTVTATIPAFQSEVNVSIPIIDDTV